MTTDAIRRAAERICKKYMIIVGPAVVEAIIREELAKDRDELREAAREFWAFIQGEYGVKLTSEDQEDHNVARFFAALEVEK